MNPEITMVMAYEPGGNFRAPTPCSPGDTVDWKRNGWPGAVRCEVVRIGVKDVHGNRRLWVCPMRHEGRPSALLPRWITDRGVLAVYDKEGRRKEPA